MWFRYSPTAIAADKLELKKAEELLDEATKKPANTDELLAIRERGIAQARAQIRAKGRRD